MTTMKSVTQPQVWYSEQSWCYQSTWSLANPDPSGFRDVVHVSIQRNAYDAQSHLSVDLFGAEDGRWNPLLRRPMTEAATSYRISYVDKNITPDHFKADVESLLNDAEAILRAAGRLS